jgi:two-component system sensor histidine kinase/response regulator
MTTSAHSPGDIKRYRVYLWLLVAGWTIALALSLAWNLSQHAKQTTDLAVQTARALYEKDILYRQWAALKGGVYVPASPDTPPNPYLDVPEREIRTPTGRELTLVNPAYMTRQVLELQNRSMGIQGHITSLNPIRPENAPDEWERRSLAAFELSETEATVVEAVDGKERIRLMRPLITAASCLKCHAKQGYRLGDVRGGISVSVPMAMFAVPGYVSTVGLAHAGLWLIGVLVLAVGWRGMRRNILARERAYVALGEAKEAADQANRVKGEFLANMSHEIRTPMNGVIGMTGLLLDSRLTAEQQHFASVIRTSADALLDIINDILDFSKIEAGGIELERIPFDLRSTVEDVMELLAVKANEKQLELACTFQADVPTALVGDPTRVRQVITNLVGNALKFTSTGEVVVRVTTIRQSETDAVVRVAVTDSGPGIPPDGLRRLFNAFSQVDASTTRKFGGTGLGLAICRRLTELMGGQIGVDSEVGKGSTFWFTVSLQKQAGAALSAPDAVEELRRCRVLVVDDNQTNRLLLTEQLKCWGAACEQAASGADALRLLEEGASSGRPFHIAVLDREMPEMDGAMVGRAIKGTPALEATRLILLTSSGRPGDAALAEEIGFAAYLRKPARQAHLLACLAGVARGAVAGLCAAPARETGGAVQHSAPLTGVRVLLAEDNRVNQLVALHVLSKLGAKTDAVANGLEAVEAVQRVHYSLVLMDVEMPEMDGLQATAAIRELERTSARRVPIVAMTAHSMKGDRERFIGAGMDGYVAKPFRAAEVLAAIESVLPGGAGRGVQGPADGAPLAEAA